MLSKLQQTSNKEIREENLEEEIKKETGEIETEQFKEFMHSSGRLITPILESQSPQRNIPLEQEIPTTPTTETKETRIRNYDLTNQTDYAPRVETENLEKRYESRIEAPVLTPRENIMRQAQFINPIEQMNLPERETMHSRFIGAEFLEHERHLPFEKEDRKYKKMRL